METIWFLFDKNLKFRIRNYLFQCSLAIVFIAAILMVHNFLFSEAIIVSIASTAFTIFVFPDSIASTPRKVIGGQLVAILSGSLLFVAINAPILETVALSSNLTTNLAAGLAVGLGIMIMIATNTEHPPAAGVALGIVLDPWQWSAIAFILASAFVLTAIRIILKPKMINLL